MITKTEQLDIRRIYFPTNDNLRKILKYNLPQYRIDDKDLWDEVSDMFGKRDYYRLIPMNNECPIELLICGAEDIAKDVIGNPNEKYLGITGSDFVIENIYRFLDYKKDPRDIIPEKLGDWEEMDEAGNLVGKLMRFDKNDYNDDRIIEMRIMRYTAIPRLCVLGPDDKNYEEMIEEKRKESKITLVHEERFSNIVAAFKKEEEKKYGITFELIPKTRKAETYIRGGDDPVVEDRYDIGMDIGETFLTAKANGLAEYLTIMPTFPVELRCYREQKNQLRIHFP